MADKVRVAIIGAGRTGAPLLKEFQRYSYIEVVGVSDRNPKAEGMRFAQGNGIFTTTDPLEIIRKKDIDIVVEVTGDDKLKKSIKELFTEMGNRKTIIMHDLVARLFVSVCAQQPTLMESLHPDDVGIGD